MRRCRLVTKKDNDHVVSFDPTADDSFLIDSNSITPKLLLYLLKFLSI